MNDDDLSFFHSWFRNYVKSYYSKDIKIQENIKLKEEHTLRVCENILLIGKALNLNKDKLYLGETIALFHDIGRFEQFKKYGTFNDGKSEDHAILGVRILKERDIFNCLSKEERSIIYKAIKYHNMREIPNNENPKCSFYSKLLRDADKLDILYVVTNYYEKRYSHPNQALELELPDIPKYSPRFIEDILNCRISDSRKLKTYNDMKLLQLGWIFDINFYPTFLEIQRKRYVEKIIKMLPKTEDIRKIRKHMKDYLKKKCSK